MGGLYNQSTLYFWIPTHTNRDGIEKQPRVDQDYKEGFLKGKGVAAVTVKLQHDNAEHTYPPDTFL